MVGAIRYQVAVIDAAGRGVTGALIEQVRDAARERGIDPAESLEFLIDDGAGNLRSDAPRVTVYFAGHARMLRYDDLVTGIAAGGNLVIPVVKSLDLFPDQVPEGLRPINGMAVPSDDDLAGLVGLIMESLRLLRARRRIFISYKRDEAQNAATQLYHELDARSFDPFLDTHSIRSGDPFQERLWHRMADCDLAVLLYTAKVLDSGWVEKELDRAHAMGITVLQVIWPGVTRDLRTEMFEPMYLEDKDFQSPLPKGGSMLADATIVRLAAEIEKLRARAMAARESRLLKTLCGLASDRGIGYVVRRAGAVDFCDDTPQMTRVYMGVGVPKGTTFYEAVHPPWIPKPARTVLMYDPFCIAPFHQEYLDWMAPHSPVESLRIGDADAWLQKLRCS